MRVFAALLVLLAGALLAPSAARAETVDSGWIKFDNFIFFHGNPPFPEAVSIPNGIRFSAPWIVADGNGLGFQFRFDAHTAGPIATGVYYASNEVEVGKGVSSISDKEIYNAGPNPCGTPAGEIDDACDN